MYLYLDCKSILIVLTLACTILNQMVADIPIEEATGQEWDLVVGRILHDSYVMPLQNIEDSPFFFLYILGFAWWDAWG